MNTPHYLRVARALALLTGLAGVAATTGCSGSHTPEDDGGVDTDGAIATDGSRPTDGSVGDAGHDSGPVIVDAGFTCDMCGCYFGVDAGPDALPDCDATGHFDCCAAIGPLFPPELAV